MRWYGCVAWLLGIWFYGGLVVGVGWANREMRAKIRAQAKHVQKGYPTFLPQENARVIAKSRPPKHRSRDGNNDLRVVSTALSSTVRVLYYVLLAVFVVVFLVLSVRFIREHFGFVHDQLVRVDALDEVGEATHLLGVEIPLYLTHQELFARGEIDLALCVLLLEGMRRVGWQDDARGKSLTVREAIGHVGSDNAQYKPIHQLLGMVEDVRFGGVLATASMYEQAKQMLFAIKNARVPSASMFPAEASSRVIERG